MVRLQVSGVCHFRSVLKKMLSKVNQVHQHFHFWEVTWLVRGGVELGELQTILYVFVKHVMQMKLGIRMELNIIFAWRYTSFWVDGMWIAIGFILHASQTNAYLMWFCWCSTYYVEVAHRVHWTLLTQQNFRVVTSEISIISCDCVELMIISEQSLSPTVDQRASQMLCSSFLMMSTLFYLFLTVFLHLFGRYHQYMYM